MSVVAGDFLKWVQRETCCITEEGAVRQLVLFHVVDGAFSAKIGTFAYDSDEKGFEDIAQEVWDSAEADAMTRSLTSRDRYTCVCFRKSEEPFSQRSFQIRAASYRQSMLMNDEDAEPANERGIIGQQLRHTEMFARLLTVSAGDQFERIIGENRRLHDALEKTQARQIDMYEMLESLNERKHERELEREAAQRKAEQSEKLMSAVMTFGPALVAQLLQNRMPMGEKAFRDDAYIGWLGGLSEEEFAGVCQSQQPVNRAAFLEIYKSARASVEAAQQSNTSSTSPEGSGEEAETTADREVH